MHLVIQKIIIGAVYVPSTMLSAKGTVMDETESLSWKGLHSRVGSSEKVSKLIWDIIAGGDKPMKLNTVA